MATKDGKIVDEINGIIASRDSIRTTMVGAGVTGVTNSSKLADLAVNLANAKLPAATYNIEASGSITIPAGKLTTGNQTITAKSLASQTSGTAAAGDIRLNKTAWVDGKQVTGSMPNATITSGSANITSTTYTYNSTNGNFGVTGSADVSAPTVGTAGYISSSAGTLNINKNKATLSATVAKIAGSTSITGTTAMTPTISRQSLGISGVTDAASGDAQTSAPTSGVWVKVNSAAKSTTLTATPSVSTAGYGTKDYHGIGGASATVNLSSADTYIPIKNGSYSASITKTNPSVSMSVTGVSTTSSSSCYVTLSTTAGEFEANANINTAGWVDIGSTGVVTAINVNEGGGGILYLATYKPSTITVTNSSQTLSTSGKVCTGNITIPAVNYYYTSLDTPSNEFGNNGDVWLVVNP